MTVPKSKLKSRRDLADHPLQSLKPDRSWLLRNWVETYLQLKGRDAAAFERLLDLPANREVKAMQMTWAEKMEAEYEAKYQAKYTQIGIEKGIEAMKRVVLRQLDQRFGQVPDSVRRKVEAIDATEPLTELAEKVLEVRSIEEMGLS